MTVSRAGFRRLFDLHGDGPPLRASSTARITQTSAGSASLTAGDGEVRAVFDGRGPQHDPDAEPLSAIIEALNERFGTEFAEADRLLFDQYVESCTADPEIAAQARNNTYDNFRLVFDRELLSTILRRHDDNDDILKRILDDDDFRGVFTTLIADEVYRRLAA